MRAAPADRTQATSTLYLICALAWFLPGAGHFWLGRRQKGIVFLVALSLMFAFGLWLQGRLFPFEIAQPLVALMAVADIWSGASVFRCADGGDRRRRCSGHHVQVRQHLHHRRRPVEHARCARCVRRRERAQVTSHLGLMVIFSLFVSVVFAVLTRDDPRDQMKFGARLFGGFVGAGILMGWLLYPLPSSRLVFASHMSRARRLSLWVPVFA